MQVFFFPPMGRRKATVFFFFNQILKYGQVIPKMLGTFYSLVLVLNGSVMSNSSRSIGL